MKTFDTLQSTYDGFYVPRFTVKIGDESFHDDVGLITGITVDLSIESANRASLSLEGRFDHGKATFVGIDWEWWQPGERLTIEAGYGNAPLTTIFVGVVTAVEPNFSAERGAAVEVSALDMTSRLDATAWDDSWLESTVGEVVVSIVEDMPDASAFDFIAAEGVESSDWDGNPRPNLHGTAPGGLDIDYEKRDNMTDRAYLEDLADRYGYEMFVRDGGFHFRRPRTTLPPAIELHYGRALRSFTPGQPGQNENAETVIVKDHDHLHRSDIVGEASRPDGDGTKKVTKSVDSQADAQAYAEAILRNINRGPTSTAETIGIPDIQIGTNVDVRGLGEPFGGNYYVEDVTHRLSESDFSTTLTVRSASRANQLTEAGAITKEFPSAL